MSCSEVRQLFGALHIRGRRSLCQTSVIDEHGESWQINLVYDALALETLNAET